MPAFRSQKFRCFPPSISNSCSHGPAGRRTLIECPVQRFAATAKQNGPEGRGYTDIQIAATARRIAFCTCRRFSD